MKPYGMKKNWDFTESFSSRYRKRNEGKGGDRHPFLHGVNARRSTKRIPKKRIRAVMKRELLAEQLQIEI
jgi:hypothetical protein